MGSRKACFTWASINRLKETSKQTEMRDHIEKALLNFHLAYVECSVATLREALALEKQGQMPLGLRSIGPCTPGDPELGARISMRDST
jgi:hypothetical protein